MWPSVFFLFADNNLSKFQQIFTKPGMCIDIVEIWLGIANGQISTIFDIIICPQRDSGRVLLFLVFICFLNQPFLIISPGTGTVIF